MTSEKPTLAVRRIAEKSADGLYTLVFCTFLFVFLSNLFTLLEDFVFLGNKNWNDGVGLYISLALSLILMGMSFFAFHRRNEVSVLWLIPHLRRAWRMIKWNWIILAVLIVIILPLGLLLDETDYDNFLEGAGVFVDVILAAVLLPWSATALLKLNDAVREIGDTNHSAKPATGTTAATKRASTSSSSKAPQTKSHVHQQLKRSVRPAQSSFRSEGGSIAESRVEIVSTPTSPSRGRHVDKHGIVYEGEWLNGRRNGRGVLTLPDGTLYVGEFVNDELCGTGVLTFGEGVTRGDRYEGEFEASAFNGNGTYYWANGAKYVGSWKDDTKHGYGIQTEVDGSVYKGEWRDDKKHGSGSLRFSDGDEYTGNWRDDEASGSGTYIWANGSKFIGNYVGWRREGFGTLYDADGSILEQGVYDEDKLSGDEVPDEVIASRAAKPEEYPCTKERETSWITIAVMGFIVMSGLARWVQGWDCKVAYCPQELWSLLKSYLGF